jgi:hypothetical protein
MSTFFPNARRVCPVFAVFVESMQFADRDRLEPYHRAIAAAVTQEKSDRRIRVFQILFRDVRHREVLDVVLLEMVDSEIVMNHKIFANHRLSV